VFFCAQCRRNFFLFVPSGDPKYIVVLTTRTQDVYLLECESVLLFRLVLCELFYPLLVVAVSGMM